MIIESTIIIMSDVPLNKYINLIKTLYLFVANNFLIINHYVHCEN